MRTLNLLNIIKSTKLETWSIIHKVLTTHNYISILAEELFKLYKLKSHKLRIPVMLIAHIDTMREHLMEDYGLNPEDPKVYSKGIIQTSTGLIKTTDNFPLGADDRAGIYTILKLVMTHNIKPKFILISDLEEYGGIGTEEFIFTLKRNPKLTRELKQLIALIQFDRKNWTDAIQYNKTRKIEPDEKLLALARKNGFKKKTGSFSDVALLTPYLQVPHLNLSIGYQHEHTLKERIHEPTLEKHIKSRIIPLLKSLSLEVEP